MRKSTYSSNPIEASSRTYKVCTRELVQRVDVEPAKRLKPKATFMATVDRCADKLERVETERDLLAAKVKRLEAKLDRIEAKRQDQRSRRAVDDFISLLRAATAVEVAKGRRAPSPATSSSGRRSGSMSKGRSSGSACRRTPAPATTAGSTGASIRSRRGIRSF